MFNKLLVANRGEIAVRIINECKQLGIKTVAICSEIERATLHMKIADEGYCIGAAPIKDSYMNAGAIINAALITKTDVIHPGYGFLSEDKGFAKACKKNNIMFVGPLSDTLAQLGDKIEAKNIASAQHIPILPGRLVKDIDEALLLADKIGYPVILKICDGGGGSGIIPAFNVDELKKAFNVLQTSKSVQLLIEKYVEKTRHIEVQIMADQHGNIITLGNRECSIQLDNKKVLEECPAQNLSAELMEKLYTDSIKLTRAVNYVGVGTMEFLVDEEENYYFIEMNARIQVEHGITEMITGMNLVQWQIKIAVGEKIPFTQEDIILSGHALECRINAQSCGQVESWQLNNREARFDHAIVNGITVTPYYYAMIGKLIAHGQTRSDAIGKMNRYLNNLHINGIKTNIDLHKNILSNSNFLNSVYYTDFLIKEGYV